MEKYILSCNDIENSTLISKSERGYIYKMEDGTILKLFSSFLLNYCEMAGENKESKILNSCEYEHIPEMIAPIEAVYLPSGKFIGYKMEEAMGISFTEYQKGIPLNKRDDLNRYTNEYLKLEDMLKRLHKSNIIVPDFCTFDNIFIDEDGNFQLIDYDDLQIGEHRSTVISTSLGNQNQYNIPKYKKDDLFTENLDIKSLITAYFLCTFNVNLKTVGSIFPSGKGMITLDYIFNLINLDDNDFMHKVWKCFNDNTDNEYISDDVVRISENYNINTEIVADKYCYKKLVKK